MIEFDLALATADNSSQALAHLQCVNAKYRRRVWPAPFDRTTHSLRIGDARELSSLADASVHLVVTSPPYFTLKEYAKRDGQMGEIADYETFLAELDKVWRECARVLIPGGRICCVVGDVCVSRKKGGRHYVLPLHADIQVRARKIGLDCLTPILWSKIANGTNEAEGNGAGFYGKPYQPGAVVKNDVEYILFLRKGGEYRKPGPTQKMLSMMNRAEMRKWLHSRWADVPGASTRSGHPAPFPQEIAQRLIRLFSFAGDVVLDPFAGTGSTLVAAIETGRNSIGVEIEPLYADFAAKRIATAVRTVRKRSFGANKPQVRYHPNGARSSAPMSSAGSA